MQVHLFGGGYRQSGRVFYLQKKLGFARNLTNKVFWLKDILTQKYVKPPNFFVIWGLGEGSLVPPRITLV